MKKLIALILALAIVMSVSVTAGATGESNATDPTATSPTVEATDPTGETTGDTSYVTMSFEKIYKITNKDYITNGTNGKTGVTFSFTAYLIGTDGALVGENTPSYKAITGVKSDATPPTITVESVTFKSTDFSENNLVAKKTVEIKNLEDATWPKVGVYYYLIKENETDISGMHNNNPDGLIMKVTVSNALDSSGNAIEKNGTGETVKKYNIYAALYDATAWSTGSVTPAANKSGGFVNKYKCGELSISKVVTGNMGDRTESFDIAVTFTFPANTSNATITADKEFTVGTDTKKVTSWAYTTSTNQSDQTMKFSLKHGETIKFSGIPDGVSWSVVETDYTSTATDTANQRGYDAASYKVNSDPAGTSASGKFNFWGTDETDNYAVTVTNNKTATVDTGVVLESLPYVLILAIVAVGAVLFLAKKKKHSED